MCPGTKEYTTFPSGEVRIYHFRGFYLYLHLELLPPGIKPNSKESYSIHDLERTGVRWLGGFNPFVRADGNTDPKERMKAYWKKVGEGFEKRAKLYKKLERKSRPPN